MEDICEVNFKREKIFLFQYNVFLSKSKILETEIELDMISFYIRDILVCVVFILLFTRYLYQQFVLVKC